VRPKTSTDRKIARIASRSHGVVTRSELLRAGITDAEIKHRLSIDALFTEYRGVYRVGHRAPSLEARYLAAVRACGEGAVLSGLAAAHFWRMVKGQAPPPEVTAPTYRQVKGVRVRRANRKATVCRGIPITTVPQTLIDLAPTLSLDDLARACHEAGVRYGTTPAQVKALQHKAPGAAKLRRVLGGDHPVTLSRLEKRFLARLEEAGLPRPITNRPAGTKRVDCRWPEHRLTVELDSYTFHNSRHSWEQDRLREREARQRGDVFLRFAQADVSEPAAMLADITRHTRGSR
jgi:very-short-patch-repair endonuclease